MIQYAKLKGDLNMLSNELEKYIDEQLPKCNSKLELSYAIYVLLGQALYYSPLYATTKRIDTVPHYSEVTLDNPYIICYTWSEIYKTLITKYGIESYIDNRNKSHSFVVLNVDGINIIADATKSSNCSIYDISNDITSIKFGLETNFFNIVPGQTNYEEKREKFNKIKKDVYKKLNIITQDEEIELYIKMLDQSELDSEERTILLINLLNSLYKLNDGEVERRQLFDRFYKKIFNDKELRNRVISILYDGITVAKKLVIAEDMYYIENEEGFRVSSREEINELLRKNIIRFKYPSDLTFYKNMTQNNNSVLKKVI